MRAVVFVHDHPDGANYDPNPSETATRDVEVRGTPPADGTFAVVGWRQKGVDAAGLAAAFSSRVDRLVLCCVPALMEAELPFDPAGITAKTLLLFGQADTDAPAKHATWWKAQLPGARIEMVPKAGSDLIGPMWKRILSHAAPNTVHKG